MNQTPFFRVLALGAMLPLASTLLAQTLPYGYPQTDRVVRSLNADWKYKMGDPEANYYSLSTDDSQWQEVTVPHTLALTSINLDGCQDDKSQKTFHRNVGWYRRDLPVSNNDTRVFLEFEGAHQITTLWVNGKQVGIHDVGGYTPFRFDITDFVKRGQNNEITLLVDNRVNTVAPPDPGIFDYIKFSGLYRDVSLVEKNPLHITSNLESLESGITITTPSVDYINGNATIDIRTQVNNTSGQTQEATLVQRVVDAQGQVVLKLSERARIEPGRTHQFNQIGGIEDNLHLWSTDNPYLYHVNTTLYNEQGEAIDVVDNPLGLRKVEYDMETGFKLNGKNIELIGFNRHQHYPYIGDAMPNSLHYRDMVQFKNYGFNVMRTAHYPHDNEILKACDELGILVYEEAPTWIAISNEHQWHANLQEAARRMIRNHRNHPSVIIWGAGINHRGAVPEIQFVVKQEDPTRLTASQSSRWTGWQNSSWTDIFANMNYGPGIWNREEPLFAMEGKYGPDVIASYKRDPMMPGMISWTAHAYYTFHPFKEYSSFPDRTRLGAMDGFRYPKEERLLWYPAEMTEAPYLHMVEDWTPEMQQMTLYSNADEVEVFINDISAGRYQPSTQHLYLGLDHPPFEIKGLNYEEGKIKLVGYREGRPIIEQHLATPQEAEALRLVVDQYDVDWVADGNDIVVVHAEVVDKNGTRIRDYEGEINFKVKGDASIVGEGENIGANPVKVKLGKGSALIRAGKTADDVQVIASSKGLKSTKTNLQSVGQQTDLIARDAYPIYDKETLLVDLGGSGQLVQFGWTPWIADEKQATLFLKPAPLTNYVAGNTPSHAQHIQALKEDTAGAYQVTIKSNSEQGVMRWLGEMNVIGKNGFVYGDGVLGLDDKGIALVFEGLPVGRYEVMTYHHAPSSNTNDMDPNLERLKTERIHQLPYAKSIAVKVDGTTQVKRCKVSEGKEQQYKDPATSTVRFEVKEEGKPVTLDFTSLDQNNGVWINGFELVRFL